jgi:hypothetical protein
MMQQPQVTDRFGTLLTLVRASFLFLGPEDALDSGRAFMKPPKKKTNFHSLRFQKYLSNLAAVRFFSDILSQRC